MERVEGGLRPRFFFFFFFALFFVSLTSSVAHSFMRYRVGSGSASVGR